MNNTENIAHKSVKQIFKETLTNNFMNMQGRATRREFNFFMFILSLIVIFLYVYKTVLTLNFKPSETINILIFTPFLILICWVSIPTIFLTIRRGHDFNLSTLGFFFSLLTPLVVISILMLFLKSSTKGPNKYGPNPYENIKAESITLEKLLLVKEILPAEEFLPNSKTQKTAEEKIKTKKPEEPINLFDPNKPSYKV